MTTKTNLQRFTTEDLHLAVYLNCCSDIEFKGVESSDHSDTKQFVFESDDKYGAAHTCLLQPKGGSGEFLS